MVSKVFLLSAVVAYVEARFGQEQVPISAISAVQGGNPGEAATIAGGAISDLLGAANACDKLATADKIFTQLGGGADALAAAMGMVTAEKNTNPFANGNAQNVCGDASLPATAELRGITPLIDPDVDVDGKVAALSKSSAASPLDATNMSVFDLLDQAGLGSLVASQANAGGATAAASTSGNANGNANAASGNSSNNGTATTGNASNSNNNGNANQASGSSSSSSSASQASGNSNNNNNNANDASGDASGSTATGGNTAAATGASTLTGGEDFGKCTPTMIFEGGQGNRPATEFTFQIADPVARGGQQEALNPNIITNALCNQLTNVCDANAAAVTACEAAKAQVSAAGTKDKSTADLFNTAMGFAGAVTNPDGGPADAPAKAANRMMRRGLRL
ncbi:hypothetical protein P280DRAFT_222079 [Massarina eburnea CBS 473.64]|uniref:Circumsporozoite protein n=1 Tax=Massarina eburnea CBS 473.64 TaxID=1395130 RepID=A0A6A6SAT9_9PLEO|nr:hypothetical protein P280DRAFT_222079 [Massarina eburnea CBS 473.64]